MVEAPSSVRLEVSRPPLTPSPCASSSSANCRSSEPALSFFWIKSSWKSNAFLPPTARFLISDRNSETPVVDRSLAPSFIMAPVIARITACGLFFSPSTAKPVVTPPRMLAAV